ncbi:MAG: hypothetical protein L6R39_007319 [Caloplaca ligustica]|nr:MAG: hypothetical protein L6R39_007319 [Caloplaca ligustica]
MTAEKTKQIADIVTANSINARTGWSDGAWWRPIVARNRQRRTEKEARIVRERFGDTSGIDQSTKERLADLINRDVIDPLLLKSRAGRADHQGNRPAMQTLRKERAVETSNAVLEAIIERSRGANVRPSPAQTQAGTQAQGRSITTGQNTGFHGTIITDQSGSASREPTSLDTAIAHRDDNTQAGTLGRKDIKEDIDAVENTDDAQPYEVQGSIQDSSIIAVTEAISEVFLPHAPFTSAVSTTEEPVNITTPENVGSGVSHSLGQQVGIITTDRSNQEVRGPPEAAPDIPQSYQHDPNTSRDLSLQSPPASTPFDRTLQSSSLQTNSYNPSLHSMLSAEDMPGFLHGHVPPHQGAGTGGQNLRAYATGWNNIKWAYRTHTVADTELQRQGIWLFDCPTTSRTQGNQGVADMALQHPNGVIVAPFSQEPHTPSLLSDGETLILFTHSTPWHPDQRLVEYTHGLAPDNTIPTRLTEYQAMEALGYHVWRHDRNSLACANPQCRKMLSDHQIHTLICLACGPKTIIRYCTSICQVTDFRRHSQECGMPQLLIRAMVDDGTAPPRFGHVFPAIRDRGGVRRLATRRQGLYAQMTEGRYTLFEPLSGSPITLVWDSRVAAGREIPYQGYSAEMQARVERCLNIALFDHTQGLVVEYLFRLLQQCLRLKGAAQTVGHTLVNQFALEFNWHANGSWRVTSGQPLCECEWSGEGVAARVHVAACRSRDRGVGEVFRGCQRSLRGLVEGMEARNWILRAWRKQHPTEGDWQRRVLGHGFPGCVVPAGWAPRFGKGWMGMWAPEDNVCG